MKTARFLLLIATFITVLSAFAVPAFAQETTATVSVSEDQINNSFRVTNSRSRNVTDVHVDLQAGQAVITANVTFRGGNPIPVTVTVVPSVLNSRMNWTVSTAAVNGNSLTADQINGLNRLISNSWRSLMREHSQPGRVTDITIDDTAVNISYVRR